MALDRPSMKNFAGFRRVLVIWLALERFVEVRGGIFIADTHTIGGRVWRRMVRKHAWGGYQTPPNIIPEGICPSVKPLAGMWAVLQSLLPCVRTHLFFLFEGQIEPECASTVTISGRLPR